MHNLLHMVTFGTRIQNNSSTAIDNIFVDNSTTNLSSISPLIKGLWEHDGEILTIKNIYLYATINKFPLNKRTRLIDDETIMTFHTLLKRETWESVDIDTDPNHMFNSFQCTFLNIFQAGFPVKHKVWKIIMVWLHKE